MPKSLSIAIGCSALGALAGISFAGRTVISSPFQMNIPFGSAIKIAPDAANIWSWHHDFQGVQTGTPATETVLVDIDGNGVMDTEHSWLRVVVTDLQVVATSNQQGIATISDGTGKRCSVGVAGSTTGGGTQPAPVAHVPLATPIVLPVGSPLHVTVHNLMGTGNFEVNLVGRIVSL